LQIELRDHAGHRVDLTAELRYEKAVHDARGRQPEMQRCRDGNDELIDHRDAVVRVNEQPFPV
jgi:hypothetical protein